MITVSRIRIGPETQAYVARRRAEGKTKMETMRCLKRYIAREIYYLLKPAISRSTPPESPLDKQKGVRGAQGDDRLNPPSTRPGCFG